MIDFAEEDGNSGFFCRGRYFGNIEDAALERQRAEERDHAAQSRVADWIVRQLGGVGFCSPEELQDFACARAVELRGRALSRDEHARLVEAARDLWFAHAPTARYEITAQGRAALRADVAA